MKYVPLADIVDGFESANEWRFVRKGANDWSIVGLNLEGQVVYELEHLYFKQCKGMCDAVTEDAAIVSIEDSYIKVARPTIISLLRSCLLHLSNGKQGYGTQSKEAVVDTLQSMLHEIG